MYESDDIVEYLDTLRVTALLSRRRQLFPLVSMSGRESAPSDVPFRVDGVRWGMNTISPAVSARKMSRSLVRYA
jgi:hypothetical protein